MTGRPNVLVILTDQQRYPPSYESVELAAFRREHLPGVERLRQNGVSFRHHYPMATACAPSRASLLTGQYPSLHGVTQTDGLTKRVDSDDMFWLAPDTVPTLGDWFRAGGYRTYFTGKWHASHAHLDAEDGDGVLLSIDDDGTPIDENIDQYFRIVMSASRDLAAADVALCVAHRSDTKTDASVADKAETANMGASRKADERIRTADPFITSEVLYQLSYVGEVRAS